MTFDDILCTVFQCAYHTIATCCLRQQTIGIAASIAITMFTGNDLATAIGVPLYYGVCEAVLLAIFCLGAWKAGWTKAPKDENVCVVLATSYEVQESVMEDPNAIEVVLGSDKDGMPSDLIFSTTEEGYQIDEDSLESLRSRESDSAGRGDASNDETGGGDSSNDEETITDMSTIATAEHEEEDNHMELSPSPNTKKESKRKLQRKGSHYSPIGAESPMRADKETVDSPPRELSAPPLENELVSSSKSGRLGNAVASIRSRTGKGKRYTMAIVDGSVAATVEEEEDEEQNFNFPEAHSPKERRLRVNDHAPIPAEDKIID